MSEKTLQPGDLVATPSGRTARVVAVNPDRHEALVQWPDADRADFRLSQLRRIEEPEA